MKDSSCRYCLLNITIIWCVWTYINIYIYIYLQKNWWHYILSSVKSFCVPLKGIWIWQGNDMTAWLWLILWWCCRGRYYECCQQVRCSTDGKVELTSCGCPQLGSFSAPPTPSPAVGAALSCDHPHFGTTSSCDHPTTLMPPHVTTHNFGATSSFFTHNYDVTDCQGNTIMRPPETLVLPHHVTTHNLEFWCHLIMWLPTTLGHLIIWLLTAGAALSCGHQQLWGYLIFWPPTASMPPHHVTTYNFGATSSCDSLTTEAAASCGHLQL